MATTLTAQRKRIGELLVQKGLLSQEQLAQVLRLQATSREMLGEILVRTGLIQPSMLLEVLSEQFGMPRERLSPEQVDWALVDQFPASALEGNGFPIRWDRDSVTVAIFNPLDVWALSTIEQAAKFRTIKTVLVSEEELRRVQQASRQRSVRKLTTWLDGR
jgi:type IV pilus assembly protein PilB